MLEKLWHDRETADNDANRHFRPGPDANEHYIIADVRRLGHSPAVEGAKNRRYAGTGNTGQLLGGFEARI